MRYENRDDLVASKNALGSSHVMPAYERVAGHVIPSEKEVLRGGTDVSPREIQRVRWAENEFAPDAHYTILARQFEWTYRKSGDGYCWFRDCHAAHEEIVEYFQAFGLRYDDYVMLSDSQFEGVLGSLLDRAAPYALDYLENPALFEAETEYLSTRVRDWIRAVGLRQTDSINVHSAFAQFLTAKPRKYSRALPTNHGVAIREQGFERTSLKRAFRTADSAIVSEFKEDRNGRFYIDDPQQHALFSGIVGAFGYEYRDIAKDKSLLTDLARVIVGSVCEQLARENMGPRWDQVSAARIFSGFNPMVIRYVSAVHGRRMMTVWRLRDIVWPEVKRFSKKFPPRSRTPSQQLIVT
ncbi:hypothetical protein [Paraburkholderia caribensis]|nr:hypothetical protein [Paraburkholderia caribensis]